MNDVIGARVTHSNPQFGNGSVVEIKGNHIIVKFDNLPDNKTFQFPNIFTQLRKMTTENKKLLHLINELTKKYTCNICGKYDTEISFDLDEKMICNECKKKLVRCELCKKTIIPDEAKVISKWFSSAYQCKKCYYRSHFMCVSCKKWFDIEEKAKTKHISDVPICNDCASEKYDLCYCCNTYMPSSYFSQIGLGLLCQDCSETHTKKCSICGNYFYFYEGEKKTLCYSCEANEEYNHYLLNLNYNEFTYKKISFVQLRNTKTVPLMSKLRYTHDEIVKSNKNGDDKPFDLLLIGDYHCTTNNYVNYVVIYEMPRRFHNLYSNSSKISTIKKEGWFSYKIGGEIGEKTNIEIDGGFLCIYNKPFRIQAQTYQDQLYGDIYYGDELVFAGNNYGDTSDFWVIGYISYSKSEE